MRLLVVTQDFPPAVGGIETYTSELVQRWARRSDRLEVVAPSMPQSASIDHEMPALVTRIDTRPDLLPLTGLGTIVQRARALEPDVAFHPQWQTVGASLLARRLTGFPRRVVCAAHGRELLFNPVHSVPGLKQGYNRLRRLLLGGPDLFTPVSRYTADLLQDQGVPPSRLRIVPNGTDPKRFRPIDAAPLRDRLGLTESTVLLTVGRLVPRKGIDTTLRALPSILAAVPDLTYLVAGAGPDRDRLERLAATLGVRDRVHFVGYVPFDELPFYYNAADLFVMPSREEPPDVEGFGIVFLEAGACGVPVVGARSGGIPDAVRHGETGLLVPPVASAALANAVTHLLTSPDLAARLGKQGRRHVVREASWNQVADQLWTVLTEAASTAGP